MSARIRATEPVVTLLLVGAATLLAFGAWKATRTEAERLPAGDVLVASKGEAFDVRAFIAPGKYTIFDFYADWCAPCRVVEPKLRQLAAQRDDVAVRKVDIVDWSSPVVKQHGLTALPHMQVYDPNGTLVAQGDDAYGVVEELFGIEIF